MEKASNRVDGEVTSRVGAYYEIRTIDPILSGVDLMYLLPGEMNGAEIGDHVRLIYSASRSLGSWRVSEILDRNNNNLDRKENQ